MSERGEAEDVCASRAKPRLEERVCERGRRPTIVGNVCAGRYKEGAPTGASASDCGGRQTGRSMAQMVQGGRGVKASCRQEAAP